MVLGVTGHRLGGATDGLYSLARTNLVQLAPDSVITGMAIGWDQAVAAACVELRIPYIAAVPFAGQEVRWLPDAQRTYRALLAKASRIEILSSKPYHPSLFMERNRWIVDRSDGLLAYWSGRRVGGTFHCLKYAESKHLPWTNCHPDCGSTKL